MAVGLSQPPVENVYTGGWLKQPLVVSLYKYPFFLPDQNSISHPPSIRGDFGVPDFSKYKGEVLIFISGKEVAEKVSLCPYCLNLLILAQFEPLFGSRVSP